MGILKDGGGNVVQENHLFNIKVRVSGSKLIIFWALFPFYYNKRNFLFIAY